jgi:hypothetical protein
MSDSAARLCGQVAARAAMPAEPAGAVTALRDLGTADVNRLCDRVAARAAMLAELA